jgi:uncharacterized membrane protein
VSALVELNKYVHDFSAAMWTCGAVVIWLISRAARRDAAALPGLAGVARSLHWVTIPALVISLVSGGVRAATYTSYEYTGAITSGLIAILAVKHVVFAAVVIWGLWVHAGARRLAKGVSIPRRWGEGSED